MKIYIVLADDDGTMRSSCDSVRVAFMTYEAANAYVLDKREKGGAYDYAIQTCQLITEGGS